MGTVTKHFGARKAYIATPVYFGSKKRTEQALLIVNM